ncbi:MAG: secondary thiamine-phosphate synthase enzyme YjbQ [Candidatus Wildermuthbacteria bacterium]|nr:secondary thiamine-phosphate synthase enzyme YjbQ [Candidatus Wildermuthbacteria bacterium]
MKISHKQLDFKTKASLDFIDFTDRVSKFVKESGFKNGLVNIQTLHTTAPLLLNENEPLLLQDLKRHLEGLSPKDLQYRHDDFSVRTVNMCDDECANGHSHCKASLLPSTLTLNLIDGQLQLGQWQRIFLLELDRPRARKVQIQIIGE